MAWPRFVRSARQVALQLYTEFFRDPPSTSGQARPRVAKGRRTTWMNRLLKQQVLDGIKAGQFSEASRRRAAAGSRSVAPIGSDANSSELRCVMPATRPRALRRNSLARTNSSVVWKVKTSVVTFLEIMR